MFLQGNRSWRAAWLLSAACTFALVTGCKPQEQITKYTVQKHHLIDTASSNTDNALASDPAPSSPQQMLGAIVLAGDAGWFFKATDAPAVVGPQADAFVNFVKSLKFSGSDGTPKWTLPPTWRELPGSGLRFATIKMGAGEEALEMSVSQLSRGEGTATEYVLTNINRWRGQLGLPPIAAADLATQSIQTKVEGHDCTLVNMTGKESSGASMSAAPFANRSTPPLTGGTVEPRSPAPSATNAAGLKFTTSEGWTEGATNQFRKASFVVNDGPAKAEITVIDLAAQGNDWLLNVNRWRGQVELPATTAAELERTTKSLAAGSTPGQYVELVGSTETILGVMAVVGDKAWFIKLKGDKALAKREKSHFEQFVKSLELK